MKNQQGLENTTMKQIETVQTIVEYKRRNELRDYKRVLSLN